MNVLLFFVIIWCCLGFTFPILTCYNLLMAQGKVNLGHELVQGQLRSSQIPNGNSLQQGMDSFAMEVICNRFDLFQD